MIITSEYKDKCYLAFKTYKGYFLLIDALNAGKLNTARCLMESGISDLIESICTPLGIGEEFIHNAKVKTLKEMRECEAVIMEEIEKHLDYVDKSGSVQSISRH